VKLVLLFFIIFFSFFTQAVVGFGSAAIAVALGAHVYPLTDLLAAFVPLNVLLSLYLTIKHRRLIDWRYLMIHMLPLIGIGVCVGMAIFRIQNKQLLKLIFGFFVTTLASAELYKMWKPNADEAQPKPLSVWVAFLALTLGGITHGLFAAGGPMIVYVVGRKLLNKGVFRATLSALWLILNCVLLVNFTFLHMITRSSLKVSAMLFPSLIVALVLGEWVHTKIPLRAFRLTMYAVLVFAGVMLILKSILVGIQF
jgi:uncharacterized protein